MVHDFVYDWIKILQTKRNNYQCTDASLGINLFVIEEDYIEQGYYMKCFFIQVGSGCLMVLTILQYFSHYNMMMRWYDENPIDGQEVARSISVGLPPEAPDPILLSHNRQPQIGHIVPEADREVQKEHLSVKRHSSIPGYTEQDLESFRPVI